MKENVERADESVINEAMCVNGLTRERSDVSNWKIP